MHPSLTLVLPVHNAQTALTRLIGELLDTIADLTSRFEIVVVDDGSTDHTEETALELCRQYPQIRVLRLPQRMGVASAVERGLAEAEGDIMLVMDIRQELRLGDLRRLWERRNDDALVTARTTPPNIDSKLLKRLGTWGAAVSRVAAEQDRQGGVQMLRRRRAGAELTPANSQLAVSDIHRTDRRTASRGAPSFLSHLMELALGE